MEFIRVKKPAIRRPALRRVVSRIVQSNPIGNAYPTQPTVIPNLSVGKTYASLELTNATTSPLLVASTTPTTPSRLTIAIVKLVMSDKTQLFAVCLIFSQLLCLVNSY